MPCQTIDDGSPVSRLGDVWTLGVTASFVAMPPDPEDLLRALLGNQRASMGIHDSPPTMCQSKGHVTRKMGVMASPSWPPGEMSRG